MLTREQLATLDRDALIEIVLAQQERIAKLERLVLVQQERLNALEARLAKNSKNSSKPPSSDPPFAPPPPRQKSGKKTGGQPGHKGAGLHKVEAPDRIERHAPEQCAHCGDWLLDCPEEPDGCWQVFDLPTDLRIEVTEHRRLVRRCPGCHQQSRGALPDWLSAETPCQWGPGARGLAVYLMQQQHLPCGRTRALLLDLFGSAPSEGSLTNWLAQAAEQLQPVEAAIAEALVAGAQVGADETPLRGAGFLHTLSNEQFTWYGCHEKRGREAMEAFGLLPRFSGLLMSDALVSYRVYGRARSLCGAHLLRELVAVSERGHLWGERMIALLLSVKAEVAAGGGPLGRDRLHAVYRWFGRVLALGRRENERRRLEDSRALLSRLSRYRDEYLRFATVSGAWFDNNGSERALRMSKLHQKVSGCFRSLWGCRALCRIRGYLATLSKQGAPLLPALRRVMAGDPLLPPLLQTSP